MKNTIKIKYLENFKTAYEELKKQIKDKNPNYSDRDIELEAEEMKPHRLTVGSSGIDLRALENYTLKSGERKLFKLGISTEISEGTELQIRPRSGLALKNGISVVNTPGTIDADYRGEIGVILINLGNENFEIKKWDRICQMVHCPIIMSEIVDADELSETERGAGGYGSTGKC